MCALTAHLIFCQLQQTKPKINVSKDFVSIVVSQGLQFAVVELSEAF